MRQPVACGVAYVGTCAEGTSFTVEVLQLALTSIIEASMTGT